MARAKQIVGIDCDAPAAFGIRLVLGSQLEEMCALRDAALDFSDPEGVHDMRVASRRLRSALRDFMPYLWRRRLTSCLSGIKDVAAALGRVRDQDVAVLALEKLADKAPRLVASSINELAEPRRRKREEARAALVPKLDIDDLEALRHSFVTSLETAITSECGKKTKQAARNASLVTYRLVARTTILDRLEEFEKLSYSLCHPVDIKPLHRMRLAAKRLRYALELFDHCWGQQAAVFAMRVAALQSSLGELHDCDLWIESVGASLSHLRKQKEARGKTIIQDDHAEALVWLLGHLLKLRTKHFSNSLARWYQWEATYSSPDLRNMLLSPLQPFQPLTANESSEAVDAAQASAAKS